MISLLNLCHMSNFYVTMLMKIDRVKIVEVLMTRAATGPQQQRGNKAQPNTPLR